MTSTLIVTNDFPPRPGGIQAFVHELAVRQDPDSLIVLASRHEGDEAFDAEQPFRVVRYPRYPMIPTPGVARIATDLVREHNVETVWFGAMAPLGLLAPALRRAGASRFVAQTHGHEVGWAATPGARLLLRRIARNMDVVTYLGDYTHRRLAPAIGALTTLVRLPPGVDTHRYHPNVDGSVVRERYGLAGKPVIVCVSRLVPRKGQDTLIQALPAIQASVPDAHLLIVGGGPYLPALRRLARRHRVVDEVIFTGAVPWDELPGHYAAGDVFAMPCRTRRGGLDVEGLGIVYLEASAVGLPVIAGDSGGAPDAVRDDETGYVVPGANPAAVAEKITTVLAQPDLATAMGSAGRAWVHQEWRWDLLAQKMTAILAVKPT